jgi:hypothetical protein
VSTEDDVLNAAIDELMSTFRAALLALAPVADRAKLGWGDNETHPDWERLAACAFDVFVRSPISMDRDRGALDAPLALYDIDIDAYGAASWIGVGDSIQSGPAMIRLLSSVSPFDTVQVVNIDLATGLPAERGLVRWEDARFFLVRRSENGSLVCVTTVIAEE